MNLLHARSGDLPSEPAGLVERLRRYALLVRLHRPIGVFLLMWPALWALWIAGEGRPPGPVVLGAAFGWAVPMAFAAIVGALPALAWWLFAATVIWVLIYDTEYSMVDRDDDLKVGTKSAAIFFGRFDRLIVGLLQILLLGMLLGIGLAAGRRACYVGGLALAAALALCQQFLIRRQERSGCFRAFLNNNYFGMLVFLGLMLDYALGA